MLLEVKVYDSPAKVRIINAAREGKQEAFQALYDEHVQQITVICRGIVGTHYEDLVLISFNKAFTRIHQFRNQSAFSTWLCRIAINESLMSIRGKRKKALREIENQEFPKLGTEQGYTDRALSGILDRIQLQRAMNHLPPDTQRTVNLAYVEGYEHREIAVMQGVTKSVVKSRLSEARSILKEHLTR